MRHRDSKKKITILFILLFSVGMLTGCPTKPYTPVPDLGSDEVFLNHYVPKGTQSVSVDLFQMVGQRGEQYAPYLKQMIEIEVAQEGFWTIVPNAPMFINGIIQFGQIRTNSFTKKSQIGNKTIYEVVKQLTITGNYAVKSRANQQTITGHQFRGAIKDTDGLSFNSMEEAKARAKSDEQLIQEALTVIANQIVEEISPHAADVILVKGKDSRLQQGIDIMQTGVGSSAIRVWQQVITDPTISTEDQAAAYYNIGVAYEARKNDYEAEASYRKAESLDSENMLYYEALARIRRKQANQ